MIFWSSLCFALAFWISAALGWLIAFGMLYIFTPVPEAETFIKDKK